MSAIVTPSFNLLAHARAARAAEKQKVASSAYLAKAATEPGAIKTESGLIYTDVQL